MADYKRFVSYMYEYVNGNKKKNVGYVRVEIRDGECRFTIHMQLNGLQEGIFPTYLIHRPQDKLDLVYLGDSVVKNEIIDSRLSAKEQNTMDSGYKFSDMGGILLFLNSAVFYATQWDDKPIILNEVLEALKPKTKTEISTDRTSSVPIRKPADLRADATKRKEDKLPTDPWELVYRYNDSISKIIDSVETPEKKTTGKDSEKSIGGVINKSTDKASGRSSDESIEKSTEILSDRSIEKSLEKLIDNSVETPQETPTDETTEVSQEKSIDKFTDETAEVSQGIPQDKNKEVPNEKPLNESAERFTEKVSEEFIRNLTKKSEKKASEIAFEKTTEKFADKSAEKLMEKSIEKYPDKAIEKSDRKENPSIAGIFANYPRINPFEDSDITRCVKIEPKDIGLLPSSTWSYSNNSFLLHGFYCYHHLIFAEISDRYGVRYILGVPGIYHNRERFMARMFGFESFKSIRNKTLRQGDFGYWYIDINL